uniref:Uncharacterized protein n=1 Tax=Rhizophagus irregularis (strain DAOM 181602 / DAOM 197198 / MUCL 43194) TaxID=747089 RepID=U9UEM4_RHIID
MMLILAALRTKYISAPPFQIMKSSVQWVISVQNYQVILKKYITHSHPKLNVLQSFPSSFQVDTSSLNCSAKKFEKFKNFFPNGPVTSRSGKTVYQVGSSKWWRVTKLNYNKHQDEIEIAQGFIQQQEHDNRLQLDAMMNKTLSNCSHTLQTYITTDTNRSHQNNLLPNNDQTLNHNILVSNKILTWIMALKQNISLTTR